MVQCEKCDKWQHVRCLFGKEDDSLLPEIYFCHICDPDLYAELISSAAAGLNTTSVVIPAPSGAIVDSVSDAAAAAVKEASNSSIDESSDISRTLVKESSKSPDKSTPQPVSLTQSSFFFSLYQLLTSYHSRSRQVLQTLLTLSVKVSLLRSCLSLKTISCL